jgi:hypothetical protein
VGERNTGGSGRDRLRFVSNLDLRLMFRVQARDVTGLEFVPERLPDGSVVLRAVVLGRVERIRRFLRRWMTA